MASARERILDALQQILATEGVTAATLEAVAEEAGVSKGGLLYHFKSKEALFEGLLDRLRAASEVDAAGLRRDPATAVERFLVGSAENEDAFTAELLAVLRLVGVPGVSALHAVGEALNASGGVVIEHVSDPVLARLIQLVGDGLYLHTLAGIGRPDVDREVIAHLVAAARDAEDSETGS